MNKESRVFEKSTAMFFLIFKVLTGPKIYLGTSQYSWQKSREQVFKW